MALHGHGSYPVTGRIIRLFGAFNDHTSARGACLNAWKIFIFQTIFVWRRSRLRHGPDAFERQQ